MKPNIFISYSRREVGFVDDLTHYLEKDGFNVWLDYRSLIPGTPWKEQIDKGLDTSDVILLVVSKASMSSKNVGFEWQHVIQENKRIILVIFEAVDLPPELEKYEWVDFRGSFNAGIKELSSQIQSPIKEEHPAPETGFKVPGIVWFAFALSLPVAFYSFSAAWSLFVPWFLVPLPWRIFRRSFNFAEVQTALWVLPITLFLTLATINDVNSSEADPLIAAFLGSILFAIVLIFVLRSPGMQRWGKPEATMPKFSDLYKPDNSTPKAVSFFIDHAPQDRLTAEEMTKVFEKHGHKAAADIGSAQVVFTLLSRYKTDTEADPEKQVVFPVLIQTVEPSQKLSKIQWIDFRGGVRNLDAMAHLLPEPAKLLEALGIRPLGNQMVLPPIIMTMRYFVILLGVFTAGAIIQYLGDFFNMGFDQAIGSEQAGGLVLSFFGNLLLIGALAFFMVRHLAGRKGFFASFPKFSLGLLAIGFFLLWQFAIDSRATDALQAMGVTADTNISVFFPFFIYFIGIVVLGIFLFFRYHDVRRWFPAKVKK